MWGEKGTGVLHLCKEATETFCASPLCVNTAVTGIFFSPKNLQTAIMSSLLFNLFLSL